MYINKAFKGQYRLTILIFPIKVYNSIVYSTVFIFRNRVLRREVSIDRLIENPEGHQ